MDGSKRIGRYIKSSVVGGEYYKAYRHCSQTLLWLAANGVFCASATHVPNYLDILSQGTEPL